MTIINEILLPEGQRFVTNRDIPRLIVNALFPEINYLHLPIQNIQKVWLRTSISEPKTNIEISCLNVDDKLSLAFIWKYLPRPVFPMPPEEWTKYADIFAKDGRGFGWTLMTEPVVARALTNTRNESSITSTFDCYRAEMRHLLSLIAAFDAGQLTQLDPISRIPERIYYMEDGLVPVEELEDYVAHFKINLNFVKPTAETASMNDGANGKSVVGGSHPFDNPWDVADPRDPKAEQPWYTPARYFARQQIKDDPTLLTKIDLLANKVEQSLKNAGIKKRGGEKSLLASTIKKAFSNVTFG